ncbi:MAG: glycosyltransferase family 87 protein [Gemmatimonadetes bacterium]|nr:glycosyltransferase family 87 protein [Gemmatimonadota bacterium]
MTHPPTPSALRAPESRRALQIILGVYVATAIAVAVQRTMLSRENNFWIFRAAFAHLRAGSDLYAAYPDVHADFFKYSPTFALLFGPFAVLPPTIGYALWATVSAVAVWYGVARLLPGRAAVMTLAIAWIAVVGDLQRAQSNALVAGLMIIAWVGYERGKQLPAAMAVAAGGFVKLFPLAAGMGALLHRRWLRFCLSLVAVLAIGAALPLVAAGPDSIAAQYRSWYALETRDAAPMPRYGTGGADLYAGLMGQFRVWFGVDWPHWPVQLAGLVILLLPLLTQRNRFGERLFRIQLLASLLVFCVLFNHQAESPSYVIAIIGAAIWFAASQPARWRTALIVACIAIVNLMSTDLMPRAWYREYYVPYLLKTIPLIPLWILMQFELHGIVQNRGSSELIEAGEDDVAFADPISHGG